jgi:hypothetical protein
MLALGGAAYASPSADDLIGTHGAPLTDSSTRARPAQPGDARHAARAAGSAPKGLIPEAGC